MELIDLWRIVLQGINVDRALIFYHLHGISIAFLQLEHVFVKLCY